jgi:hypothetical protein
MKQIIPILTAALGLIISATKSQAQVGFLPPTPTAYTQTSNTVSTDLHKDKDGKILDFVEHVVIVQPLPAGTWISPEASAARAGAYAYSYTLNPSTHSYNHDGLAFMGLHEKLAAAAIVHANELKNDYKEQTAVIALGR